MDVRNINVAELIQLHRSRGGTPMKYGIFDDTAIIQGALDSANSDVETTVSFPFLAGGYNITSGLNVHSNTRLVGIGWGTSVIMVGAFTGTTGAFSLDSGSSNITVDDLYIDTQKSSKAGTTNSRGIYIPNSTQVRINRCFIKDPGAAGVEVVAGSDIGVTGCRITGGGDGTNGARSHAIGFAGNTSPSLVDCWAIGNHIEGAMDTGLGFYTGVARGLFMGNTILTATGMGMHAIDCEAAQHCSIVGNIIQLAGDALDAILIHPHTTGIGLDNVVVCNNNIKGVGHTAGNGIVVNGCNSGTGLDVKRITLNGNIVQATHGDGLFFGAVNGSNGMQECVVVGNLFSGCAGNGINISGGGGGNIIFNNVFADNALVSNGAWGLAFANSSQVGNIIRNNLYYGNTSGNFSSPGGTQYFEDIQAGLSTSISRIQVYSQSLTPAAFSTTTSEQTFTVTGLATNDKVMLNAPAAMPAGVGIAGVRVSATNTLAVTFTNQTGGSVTPTSGTYAVLAVRS